MLGLYEIQLSIVALKWIITFKAHQNVVSFQLDFNVYSFFMIKLFFKKDLMILLSSPLPCIWFFLLCFERHIQDISSHCQQLKSEEINKKQDEI